jgi:hypothetical protein
MTLAEYSRLESTAEAGSLNTIVAEPEHAARKRGFPCALVAAISRRKGNQVWSQVNDVSDLRAKTV